MIARTWRTPAPVTVPDDLLDVAGGVQLLAETLMRRGITSASAARAFLDPAAYKPTPPEALPNMARAAARLSDALRRREPLLVWGDFDVDGQTSTTLLVTALRSLGATVRYFIPSREDGHGIKLERLKQVLDDAAVIVTCDTGIAEHESIAYAQSRGVDVIVTDHHQLPAALPHAFACVNPQMLDGAHPLATLPGVGCAYKLVEMLSGEPRPDLLDLVALGIVADVAVQRADARYLLQRGLQALRITDRLGLRELMQVASIAPEMLTEEDIAFALAPRLNALGRLDDANTAVEFLSTSDLTQARILAQRIDGLNNERKLLSQQITDAALNMVERDPSLLDYAVLVLAHPQWAASVLGIVANRLVEVFNRPVILLATPPGGLAHGSARSVAGCDITAALAAHSDLLHGYGGHTMAAGLRLDEARLPELRRLLSRTVDAQLEHVERTPVLAVDAFVALGALTRDFAAELARLAPFGAGNPPLVLAAHNLTLKSHRMAGRSAEHAFLIVEDASGTTCEVAWWRAGSAEPLQGRFDLAFTVREHLYKGERRLQMTYVDARIVEERPVYVPSRVTLTDLRGTPDPLSALRALPAGTLIWHEGEALPGLTTHHRDQLVPAQTLAIATIPPGDRELMTALERVAPSQVILVGMQPSAVSAGTLLTTVAGMVKFALNSGTPFDVGRAAAAVGQREVTITRALEWLEANGTLALHDDGRITIGTSPDPDQAKHRLEQITALLEETAAYRDYFARAENPLVWRDRHPRHSA